MESNVSIYRLEQGGKQYELKISIIGDRLRISCKSDSNKTIKFLRDYSVEDLKELDQIFNFISSPFEALKYLEKTIQDKKVKITEKSDHIKIKFYFESGEVLTGGAFTTTTTTDYSATYNYQNVGYDTTYANQYSTSYENTSDNYLQNLENANYVTDATYDINNVYTTGAQNYDTTQYQETYTTDNTYNQYSEVVSTPVENYQTYEQYSTPYIAPIEENTNDNFHTEILALKNENESIRQQIQNLNDTKTPTNEYQFLQNQLNEYGSINQKAYESDAIRAQLSEIYFLKQKVRELTNSSNRLNEMNSIKKELEQINALKKEINALRNLGQKDDENELREKIRQLEIINLQHEKEIRALRGSQINSEVHKGESGMESKQLEFEERTKQIRVKGDIIHNAQELELITRKINKSNRKLTLNLLYKATVDSDKAEAFHNKCDKAQSTLVLVETDKGKRFGGFTKCTWAGNCVDKKDNEAFIFSLDKMKVYNNIPNEEAIGCYPKFGPIFMGCQIRIYDNAFSKPGSTFEKGLNYYTEEDYELTGGEREFNVKEIEVYEVIAS